MGGWDSNPGTSDYEPRLPAIWPMLCDLAGSADFCLCGKEVRETADERQPGKTLDEEELPLGHG